MNKSRSSYVAIVGPANSGKSTLLNTILGQKVSIVSRKQQSTRSRVFGVLSRGDSQLVFIDTPGFLKKQSQGELHRFLNAALHHSIEDADTVVVVVDVAAAIKERGFARNLRALLDKRNIPGVSILVLNKTDKIDRRAVLPLTQELSEAFADQESLVYLPLSAKSGDGVEELVQLLIDACPEGPWYFDESQSSDQSDEFLAAEIIREPLFDRLHQEIPYSCAVQVHSFVDEKTLLRISASVIVEKDSQKGIVIGSGGTTLKGIGTAARKLLEKQFGKKVFLELRVIVEPEWSRTTRGMQRVGIA